MQRTAMVPRKTRETEVTVTVNIDGTGSSDINSGNGFMDHMLTLFAKHGLLDLGITCKGDTNVDFHHSTEDIGICLGQAFAEALNDFRGVIRYATAYVPMDESLARVCVDLCGRSNIVYNVPVADRVVGTFECDLVEDFLKAFVDNARITIHVDLIRGRNSHHSIEAVFKALGRALGEACAINPRAAHDIPSTKGSL